MHEKISIIYAYVGCWFRYGNSNLYSCVASVKLTKNKKEISGKTFSVVYLLIRMKMSKGDGSSRECRRSKKRFYLLPIC